MVTIRRSSSSGGVGRAAGKPAGPTGSSRVPSQSGGGVAATGAGTPVSERDGRVVTVGCGASRVDGATVTMLVTGAGVGAATGVPRPPQPVSNAARPAAATAALHFTRRG